MASITAGVFTSHVPAIGAAIDNGRTGEPYWQPVFAGYEFSRRWIRESRPDVVLLVYNDHASAFSLEMIPPSRSAAPSASPPPTRAGARARYPRWSATRTWPGTSHSR